MISFKQEKNNPTIVKVYYKTIQKGRIIINEEGLYEYQEIGHSRFKNLIHLKGHPTLDDAKQHAIERLTIQLKDSIDISLSSLTDLGREFLSKFTNGPVLRKLLSEDEVKVANLMVREGLLEKGRSDDSKASVIFYMDVVVQRKLNID